MSDLPADHDHDDQPEDNLAELRRAADEGRKARAEAEAARRELAFAKAGIDTESGVGKLLFTSYAGEPTKDAVLAAAAEYGITPGTNAEAEPHVPDIPADERAMSRERAQLAAGAEVPAEEPSVDPNIEGLRRFREAKAAGRTHNEAAAAYYGEVLAAAMSGDKRVIHDPAEWAAKAAAAKRGA